MYAISHLRCLPERVPYWVLFWSQRRRLGTILLCFESTTYFLRCNDDGLHHQHDNTFFSLAHFPAARQNQCWCSGKDTEFDRNGKLDDSACGMACTGGSAIGEKCGDFDAISAYAYTTTVAAFSQG